ncbi:hypothetical protein M413DRAFT_387096 [Hebeloma cylindrosporum]|uniref:Uncharacterized protein n=1 Tax=Hebeloma cylindrosporum TaxID=76867 RepID=A0A0C2YRR1_HEBCY|nr:hypothetical protein M413DRAFT_387096 [Hebeloma cylindrosporum h7]
MSPTGFAVYQGTCAFPSILSPYIGAVMLETFLYGLYVILFAICVYVLWRKKTISWVLLAFAVAMFALATADLGYTFYLIFGQLMKGSLAVKELRPKFWLYVANNVLADSLLLYRCYVVWGCKKIVVIGPAIPLIGSTVCGFLFEGSTRFQAWIYVVTTLILNLILTGLTAGRIWWLARKARLILGTGLLQRYNTTIVILIESGVLYSLYIILDLVLLYILDNIFILDAGLIQVVGIIPTLIIVQVGLGRAVRDMGGDDPMVHLEANKNTVNRSYPELPSGCEFVPSHSRDCLGHASSQTFIIQHDQTRSETTIASPTWPPSPPS